MARRLWRYSEGIGHVAQTALVSVRSFGTLGESLRMKLAQVSSSVTLQAALLFALTLSVYMFVGHVDGRLGADERIKFVRPAAISGDEPHYLVVINSIIFDHDVRLGEDHKRIAEGGLEAGSRRKGKLFGGHAALVNTKTGARTRCPGKCGDKEWQVVGGNREDLMEVPSHPVAFPAFIALLSWPFQPERGEVEALTGELAILIGIAGVLLTYRAARAIGLCATAAFASAALLGFASSWLPYARSYFAESAIGVFLLLGFIAMRARALVWAGLAIGVATAMKSAFVLVGFVWIAERLWARRFRESLWLMGSLGAAGVLQVLLNLALLRAPFTIGAGPWSSAKGLRSLEYTLLNPAHGLLVFVPWACVALLWGTASLWAAAPAEPNADAVEVRRQLALPALALLVVFSIIGWGVGTCYGPRYWVPLLPFLAILAVEFAVVGRAWRAGMLGVLAAVSLLIAVPGAIKYRFLFSKPALAALFQREG